MTRRLAVISGISEGLGVALAVAFAGKGYDVVGLARSNRVAAVLDDKVRSLGATYTHCSCDITDASQVDAALTPIVGRARVLVHNAQLFVRRPFEHLHPSDFERSWRIACLGAMVVAQCVLPAMILRGDGTIIFAGATASRRGSAGFSALASAKFALRGMAQSLAREFGPQGIHIVHTVIDGLIDGPQTASRFPDPHARLMQPEEIAKVYLGLVEQHRSAWSHELDLRPCDGRF